MAFLQFSPMSQVNMQNVVCHLILKREGCYFFSFFVQQKASNLPDDIRDPCYTEIGQHVIKSQKTYLDWTLAIVTITNVKIRTDQIVYREGNILVFQLAFRRVRYIEINSNYSAQAGAHLFVFRKEAPFAFEELMAHSMPRVTLPFALCCVRHRYKSQGIHRWETIFFQSILVVCCHQKNQY